MKALLQEFKTFAVQGNVMDMAVGVVIGAAFGKIVASLVTNVIMPPIGISAVWILPIFLFPSVQRRLKLLLRLRRRACLLLRTAFS